MSRFICQMMKGGRTSRTDRKSTRLNSSHDQISYAVFCLKKKNRQEILDRKSRLLNSSHDQISYAVFCLKNNIKVQHQYDSFMCTPKYSKRRDRQQSMYRAA